LFILLLAIILLNKIGDKEVIQKRQVLKKSFHRNLLNKKRDYKKKYLELLNYKVFFCKNKKNLHSFKKKIYHKFRYRSEANLESQRKIHVPYADFYVQCKSMYAIISITSSTPSSISIC
jgi:hypothetical protein